ncbi:MAG: hypothetical protein V1816_12900 [Pseudomonadota bacterium]
MDYIGLVTYGYYLPRETETAAAAAARAGLTVEDVLALGLTRKFIPAADDQPVVMAREAARRAFEKTTEVRPENVDAVIWIGEEYKDYIAQTASIRLQEELGCRNAFAFDLVGQGVTSIVGLRAARDLILGDSGINAVLLAGGSRNIDLVDYSNPDTRFLLPYSCSGGAMILKRNAGRARLLNLSFHVDPEMADEVYVPGGGCEIPFTPDNLGSYLMYFHTPRPALVAEYLLEAWSRSIIGVINSVAKGGRVDFLALRHLGPRDRDKVLAGTGVAGAACPALDELGHHGPNDVILALDLGLRAGLVRDGALVVMASGGIGFAFGAASFLWER